ncbi:MAG: alpha/beta fold hydrolase [Luminiphilus sp.]|jgi:pimeloyl-ACP methyl ester carboxylesterase|tara:strand:- start:2189 stop:3055 length:867 start_codon:yes stop_codon:yes gene_type:complete
MQQLEKAIDSNGASITGAGDYEVYWYYDIEAEGRPLLFVHSINAAPSAIDLKPLFQHFRSYRSVYAPDLPGFGRSTRHVGMMTASEFAKNISSIIDQISPSEPPDVIALSLGCEFVARAVVECGANVRSLTFISPTGFSRRQPPPLQAQKRLRRLFDFAGFGRGAFKLLRLERSIRYFYGMNFSGSVPSELVAYALKTTRQPAAHEMPLQFLSMSLFTPNAVGSLYEKLDVPVLVLFDEDPNVTFELFEQFEDSPIWQFKRIAPSLGMPQWEHPEKTVAAIESFFAEL